MATTNYKIPELLCPAGDFTRLKAAVDFGADAVYLAGEEFGMRTAAAVSPTENFEYYYFVTDAQMKFYYNKTLAQHNSTIAKLKKENNWIGDN